MPARLVRRFTGFKYSHTSVSMRADLLGMCSFSRTNIGNPFVGGFVLESPRTLTLGKNNTSVPVKIFKVPVSETGFAAAESFINSVRFDRDGYMYNIITFITAPFGRTGYIYKSFICTTFALELLKNAGALPDIPLQTGRPITPKDINSLLAPYAVFEGEISEYTPAEGKEIPIDEYFVRRGIYSETKRTARYVHRLIKRRIFTRGQ
jgi:hypothetical protein